MQVSLSQFLLILLFMVNSYADGLKAQAVLEKRISIQLQDKEIRKVLGEIKKQASIEFAFSKEIIDADRKISISAKNETLGSVLNAVLKPLNLTYQYSGSLIIIMRNNANKVIETTPIKGKITNNKGEELPGASVILKGTTRGAVTNEKGDFSIESVTDGNYKIVITYIGYATKEVVVTVPYNGILKISLTEELSALDEVVVVGYGSQLKKEVTGSVQNVNAKDLQDLPVAQVTQKLQGRLAGVQITQTTGKPGQGMSVRVRGQASISADNSPLYVVDGFSIVGDLSGINPDEIESISVLKDAASTSLYGSRAANGVVLIQTKGAKKGSSNFSFSTYYGVQQVPQKGRPDMMNAQEFAQFQKDLAEANGRTVNPLYANPSLVGVGTDWYDVLLRTAPVKNYSLNYSSANEKSSVSVIGGYFTQDGVLKNSDFSRYSLRANSTFKPVEQVKIGFNIAPTYSINNTPQSDGVWWTTPSIIQSAILTTPFAKPVNDDGSIPLTATGPGLFANPNWYNVLNVVQNETKSTRLLSNAYLEYEPIKDLFLKTSLNADLLDSQFNNYTPSTAGQLFSPPPRIPTAIQNTVKTFSWLLENTATYRKTVGDHNFDVLGGFTSQKFTGNYTNTNATGFPDDQIRTFNAATSTLTTTDVQEWSLLSYIGRVNYSFKNKYLFTAAIRRDGSSRFGSDNKWGNFPSVSAGWIVSEESFMPKFEALSFLKLRASYGLIGNNNIGNYTHYASVNNTNYAYGSTLANGRSVVSLGNSNLGWEQTKQFDFGIDFGLLNDRITLVYDYYQKNTDGLLYQVSIPYSAGFSNVITNIGSIDFWGHEFSINSKNIVNGDLKWNTDFNISFNRNKVTKLGTANAPIYGTDANALDYTITQVGKPLGQFYGYEQLGFYVNQEDFDKSPKHTTSVVGSIKFRDINNDGKIDANDQTAIGDPTPKFIFGFVNTFSYKKFDASIVASGSYGNKIAYMFQEFVGNLDGVFNVEREVMNRWKSPSEPGNGKYGTLKTGASNLNRTFNSGFLYDGSFFTIKNITLGYKLPINSRIIKSARVYASIQQALVLTNYKGANPEVTGNRQGTNGGTSALSLGFDHQNYPVPRTYSLGLNFNF